MNFINFRLFYGFGFILISIFSVIFLSNFGIGFLIGSIFSELFSFLGYYHLSPQFSKERSIFMHHWVLGAILIIITLVFFYTFQYFLLFLGIGVSVFLHDAIFHLLIVFIDVDSNEIESTERIQRRKNLNVSD